MKKILSLVLAVLLCGLSTSVWAEKVSKDEAAQLAGQFFSAKFQTAKNVKKAAPASTSAVLNAKQVASAQQLQVKGGNLLPMQSGAVMNKAASATLTPATKAIDNGVVSTKVLELPKSLEIDQFYIVQEEDEDGGWVIMAADDAVKPILAYSKTGTFRTDNMPDNLKDWLGQYNEQIKKVAELKLTADPEVIEEWSALRRGVRRATQATEVVSALVKTRWDQDAPYYNNCPTNSTNGHSVVGCVATAMAQVMKYWEWPNQPQGSNSYSSANYGTLSVTFSNYTYDWSNMPNRCYTSSSTAEKNAVALLSYHCGVAVNMDYNNSANGGSGAYTLNYGSDNEVCAQNALWKYFKYDYSTIKSYYRNGQGTTYASWTEANWIAMLKAELDLKRPIIYSGRGTGGGHCFICDGYDSQSYFHFNWGWSGSNDGFYSINNLVPGSGGSGGGSYSFSNNQGCIIGIQPVVSDKFTVSFDAGSHANCGTTSLTQANVGDAVILPNVTNVAEHYIFLGWSDKAGSSDPNIGVPGDSYVPMRNITLHAVVVQDGYVVHFIPTIENGTVAVVVNDTTIVRWDGTPNWSGHGSCDVDSLREEGTGSGIILPGASNNAGWTFQEWIGVNSSRNLYVAGHPGDLFKPSSNMNIFGYWTEDSKVWLDYLLLGVTQLNGPEEGWLEFANGLTASFTAAEDFYALTTANTTVTVEVDGEAVTNCYSIANGVLTITLTAEQITGDVDITIQATQNYTPCFDTPYSYTYTASKGTGSNIVLGAYTWKISKTGNGAANSCDATLGQQFGTTGSSSAAPVSPGTVTYTTSTPADCHINTISIQAAATLTFTYAQYQSGLYVATIEAFIGDSTLGKQGIYPDMSDDPTSYTYPRRNGTTYYNWPGELNEIVWQNTGNLTGDLKFVITPTFYSSVFVKSINVSYSESVLGGPYHVPVTDLQAYYLPDDDKYVWYAMMYGSGNYPYVETIFDAADETSFAGTHSTYGIYYEPNANEGINSTGRPKLTLTYKSAYNAYYNTYHASANWSDDEGRQYYVDDDVDVLLINYECWAAAKAADEDASLADHTDCIDHPTSDEGGTTIAYTVNHYLQKVDGSGYDLEETATFNTKSGNTVTGAQNSYTGFVTPAPKSITVSNTNKTIDYYYNRRTYPVHFVVNNIIVQRDTLRYKEMPAYRGETPVRAATDDYIFEFAGWSPSITNVKQAATYTAQFTAIPLATVIFDANGYGTAPASQTVFPGETITRPADPVEEGYIFGGWYREQQCTTEWNFDDAVAVSMVLYAKWIPNPHTLYIVHHFQQNILDNDWTEILPVDSLYGTANTLTDIQPAVKPYPGFDVQPFENVNIAPDGSTEVSLYYVRREFVIRFLVDGTVKQEETLRFDATPAWHAADPTKDADDQFTYRFAGWDPAITTVKADQDYNAKWDSILIYYTVSFNNNGHGGNTTPQSIGYGYKVAEPEALSETGWTFGGWYKEAACNNAWNFATDVVNGPTELFAKWTVNVHYLEWNTDGDELTGDYTNGNVEFGTAIVQPNTPTKTGYDFARWDGTVTPIPATMPDRDLSYTAQWNPATHTQYIVKHFQQNIAGDEYVEVEADRQILYGTTEENVTPAVKNYAGFDSPEPISENIKADGSLVIEYRYDRKSFNLVWDVNGGDALSGDYTHGSVKFGANITAPANPTWTGYSFTGWQPEVPAIMPDSDLTLVAQWTEFGETPYTVKHFKQNLDLTYNTVPDAVDNLKGKTNASVTPGVKTFEGFTAPATLTTATILADGSLVIEYRYTRNTYNLSWDANGGDLGSGFSNGAILFDDDITAPVPTREGYGFNNWDGTVPAKMPANDLSFKAQWTPNTDTEYKVEHWLQNVDDDEYTLVKTESRTGTSDAPVTPAVINYDGFTAPTPTEENIEADGSLVVIYKYTRNSYNLTWDVNGGDALSGDYTHGSVKFGKTIVAPDDPTWRGHTFHGWDKTVPATMPADNLTLKAQWTTDTYPGITFKSEDETEGKVTVDPNKDSYQFGDEVTITAEANDGYHFTGWSDGNTDNPRTITIDENTQSLTATFAPDTDTRYTVEHWLQNVDDDEFGILYQTDPHTGTTGAKITDSPLRISGFMTPASQEGAVAIAGDGSTVIRYEYTRMSFDLTWDANGGSITGDYTHGSVKFGKTIVAPANENVTYVGYTFKGWDKEIPATMPAEATRFTAVWEANVVEGVSFSSENPEMGTVTVNPQKDEYKVGDVVVVTAEANDGYHFVGWSDGGSDDASRVVTVDENTGAIVAIFAPNEDTKFHIHVLLQNIDDDEFTLSKDIEATGITGTTVAPEPELIEGFETPDVVSATIKGDGSTIIEQKYIRKSFELVWNTDGGDFGECEYTHGQVKFGANIIAPADPVKAHFFFIGWDQEIPETMPAENVTITARWEADPTGIEVVVDGRTILGNGELRIFDFNGRDVTGLNGNLGRGFYIVVSGGAATKVAIQ